MNESPTDSKLPEDPLERELDELGAAERRMFRDAKGIESAPGLARVEATLRAEMRSYDASRLRERRRRWLGLTTLIAASIVVIVLLRSTSPDPRIPELPLGDRIEILEPAPGTEPYAQLRWKYPDRPGVRFEVRVFARGDDVTSKDQARYRRSELRERELDFPITESIGWPDQIIIVVGILDADGQFSASSRVSRSRR